MRIGLLASVGHMVDSFFHEIIDSWVDAGHTVSVAAGTPTADGESVVISGLGRRPGSGTLAVWSGLRAWARDETLDIVLTNSATASALVRTARLRIPVVYFCHGLHWNIGTRLSDRVWQMVEEALLRRTDAVITINSDDHAWFTARVASRQLLRLHTGVGLDLERYREVRPPSEERPPQSLQSQAPYEGRLELVWIGEFSARKRPESAVEVAAGLRSLGVDFRLRMIGEGSRRGVVNDRIRRLGLTENVAAAGSGSAAAALSGSHGLLHTATWEGLPRVMLEGVAVGRRAYAFDVKGVRDVPEVVLVADGDVDALVASIWAEWSSGRMTAPLSFDRTALDSTRSADAVRNLLEALTDPSDPGTGRIAVRRGTR